MTAAAIPYLLAASAAASAYTAISSGQAQKKQADAQAKQAEADARTQLIDRKRALIETMAAQNVSAAAQGRTISSISTLQNEDVRRAGYDANIISLGGQSQSSNYRAAGSAAQTGGYISGASTLLGGLGKASLVSTPSSSTPSSSASSSYKSVLER